MVTHHILGENALEWSGVAYRTILPAEKTNGAISVIDTISPDGSGPPRHIHHNEDETFYVLSGECEFWLEGQTFVRGPGEAVFVPRGMEHTFRVIGGQPGRHLVILTPGGFEAFFAEMAGERLVVPQDMPQIVERARKHNLSFTGPPLGAG